MGAALQGFGEFGLGFGNPQAGAKLLQQQQEAARQQAQQRALADFATSSLFIEPAQAEAFGQLPVAAQTNLIGQEQQASQFGRSAERLESQAATQKEQGERRLDIDETLAKLQASREKRRAKSEEALTDIRRQELAARKQELELRIASFQEKLSDKRKQDAARVQLEKRGKDLPLNLRKPFFSALSLLRSGDARGGAEAVRILGEAQPKPGSTGDLFSLALQGDLDVSKGQTAAKALAFERIKQANPKMKTSQATTLAENAAKSFFSNHVDVEDVGFFQSFLQTPERKLKQPPATGFTRFRDPNTGEERDIPEGNAAAAEQRGLIRVN